MPIIPHLVVNEYGSFVSKKQGRVRVSVKQEKRVEAPLMHLETVLIAERGVSVSADAVAACAEQGIPIHIIDHRGAPVASMYASALIGTVQTRRAQLLAYADERGLHAAKALALGKIRNQSTLLKYIAKYRKDREPELHADLRDAATSVLEHEQEILQLAGGRIDAVREQILSAEGRAAKHYWAAVKALVPSALSWPGRKGRGADDAVNMALNYGYGVLYGEVERALVLAGLDPYAGFLHTDRPGKPSLVLDMIEPYRAPTVDRTVLAILGKGTAIKLDSQGRLTTETRRMLADKVHQRLDAPARYQGKRLSLRAVLQAQGRELALYFRGERSAYVAYLAEW